MSARRKKNALFYAIALACSLTAIFITYSCSTDEYYTDETQMAENGIAKTRGFSSRMLNNENTLIDSIASSDEFWEFEMSSELLADKFHEYTSTLSEEEYDKQNGYLQPIITQYFIDNKSEIWLLFLIAHSKR